MQTLLFCFANHSTSPLNTLQEEYENIDRLLDTGNNLKHFLKVPVPFASTESVARKINVYRDSLTVFHFSGHANHTVLHLEDTAAGSKGIARLLGRCPNLKLIFLNGCSTKKHIEQLAAQNIQAAIIATYAPVEDRIATKFSTAFYEALEKQKSLEEAVHEAKLFIIDAQADQLQLDKVSRGIGVNKEVSKHQWYFYCPTPEQGQWKLPSSAHISAYVPNAGIRRTLFTALGNKDWTLYEEYKTVQSQYSDEGLMDWAHKQILERLPYPLAEPLRRLFRREFSQSENRWQPIALSHERLENYLILVDNSLFPVISALLAQIRDRLLQLQKSDALKKDAVAPAAVGFLQELQTKGWLNLLPDRLITVIQTLHALLIQWEIPLFAEGMDELMTELNPTSRLYESLVFFYELRRQLALPSGVPNVAYYCEVGEEHLKYLLERIGFWTRYRLESIGQIRIITSFDLLNSRYIHEKVALRSTFEEDVAKKMLVKNEQDSSWNCQSVMLVNQKNQYLNLSPFIIDRNVYKKSNTTFDLYTFHHFQNETLSFIRLVYPAHPPLEVRLDGSNTGAQDDFSILLEQAQIIFGLIQLETFLSPPPQNIPTLRI